MLAYRSCKAAFKLAQISRRVTSEQHIALMVTLAVYVQVRWQNMSVR